MRKTTTASLATLSIAAALALSACGSSSSGGNSSGNDTKPGAKNVSAACNLSSPTTSGASAPASGDSTAQVKGKVGVILPDTTSSTRYTLYDKPLLQKSLTAAGITPDIQNAGGSTSKFASIAQSMIGEGVKVLIIDSIDAPSGAGVEKAAAKAGVKVIDYDRVNLGGSADYYVSFDNEDVGKLQAQTLVDCLDKTGVSKPNIMMMDGGTDVDNNAVLFKKGAHTVLDPLKSSGKLNIVSESVVKGWKVENAAPTFTQALTANGGKVDGVLAANDDIANAVIGVLKGSGLNGHVVVTGQDSGVEGLQNIVNGQQSMTIFKDVKLEAQAAAKLAIALIQGKDVTSSGLTLSDFADPQAPDHKIKALLLPSVVITQANLNDVVKAGALTTADICKNITSACSKVGLK
ncbi:MAG: sugar ABC transporter substrate-binding protein [Marmoricola sp.]